MGQLTRDEGPELLAKDAQRFSDAIDRATKDGTPIPINAFGLERHIRYRHEAYSRRIGGAKDSYHRLNVSEQTHIGLVGCGRWGKFILRDLVTLGCNVVVVARSERSRVNAHECGAASIVRSLDELPAVAGPLGSIQLSEGSTVVDMRLERAKQRAGRQKRRGGDAHMRLISRCSRATSACQSGTEAQCEASAELASVASSE